MFQERPGWNRGDSGTSGRAEERVICSEKKRMLLFSFLLLLSCLPLRGKDFLSLGPFLLFHETLEHKWVDTVSDLEGRVGSGPKTAFTQFVGPLEMLERRSLSMKGFCPDLERGERFQPRVPHQNAAVPRNRDRSTQSLNGAVISRERRYSGRALKRPKKKAGERVKLSLFPLRFLSARANFDFPIFSLSSLSPALTSIHKPFFYRGTTY